MKYVVKREVWHKFLNTLRKSFDLVGPVKRDIVRYDYLKKNDELLFKCPIYPVKTFFLPEDEVLFEFKEGKIIYPEIEFNETIFFMPRCDVNSLNKLDFIYLKEPVDPYYKIKRDKSIIVEISCSKYGNCFCDEMDLIDAFDIKLEPVNHHALALTGRTPKGIAILEKLKNKQYLLYDKSSASLKKTSFYEKNISEDNAAVWDKHADRCLSCSACTVVCPTCSCFHVDDKIKMGTLDGARSRKASSCQLYNFTGVAGGHVFRKERPLRVKQRVLHKMKYFKEQHGEKMCVGCGRCTASCPTGIDIKKIWNELK